MRREAPVLLEDARMAVARIREFIDGVGLVEYEADVLRRSAVERQLEILGEALGRLRRVDPETAALVPDVNRIIGMRNVLAHGYAVVNNRVVWLAATSRVPEVAAVIDELMAAVDAGVADSEGTVDQSS